MLSGVEIRQSSAAICVPVLTSVKSDSANFKTITEINVEAEAQAASEGVPHAIMKRISNTNKRIRTELAG
jgi:hypothetical protein